MKNLIILLSILLSACNGGSTAPSNSSVGSGNVVPLIADAGYNGNGTNRSYITITLCQSGTENCQTIDHILVDSGSTGLRINQSALTLTGLTPITYQGIPVYECMLYGAGYGYGPAVTGDLKLANEVASNIPIQIFYDTTQVNVPDSCSQSTTNFANLNNSGAHGIIGINPYSNPNNQYTAGGVFACTTPESSSCTLVPSPDTNLIPLTVNPISAFAQDNNGAIFDLPNVPTATNTPIIGSLIFGLNTQNNNQVPTTSITKVPGNPTESFPVGFFNAYSGSVNGIAIFDSGTPLYAFYYTGMAACPITGILSGYYCPNPSPQNWNSLIQGYNSTTITNVSVPILNYTNNSGINDTLIPYLGAISDANSNLTIYGLTFFFGQKIYLGFMGQTGNQTPIGTGPAWAYSPN